MVTQECVYFMKCSPIQPALGTKIQKKNKTNFKGVPSHIGYIDVRDWHDAVKYWNMLRRAKYLDVHSDGSCNFYKYIRDENYSFLDKLNTHTDKSEFISRFCEFTEFPNLKAVSQKIADTFESCIESIADRLNVSTSSPGEPYKVLDSGYDPTCSIALEKALPGSDLDKGYIILEGNHMFKSDEDVVNTFSSELWEELDQRIVSLNHPDTFPAIYTKQQVKDKLHELNTVASDVINNPAKNGALAAAGAVIGNAILGPFGVPVGMFISGKLMNDTTKYLRLKASTITTPHLAAEFNIEVAKRINSLLGKEEAKNFAFFSETVEANLPQNAWNKTDELFDEIKDSVFVKNSNVTQINAWISKIRSGYMKEKLKQRTNISRDFKYNMTTEERYDLIKDLIKYSSEDQSSKYSKIFKNDDNIKERYRTLLRELA